MQAFKATIEFQPCQTQFILASERTKQHRTSVEETSLNLTRTNKPEASFAVVTHTVNNQIFDLKRQA
jgi:hypothetical protein